MGRLTDEDLSRIEQQLEVEYIYNTNSMEGNTLTAGQTLLVLKGITVSGKPLSDIQEVRNNPQAIAIVKELAFNRQLAITEDDILTIHKISMSTIIDGAGRYRENDVSVIGAGFTPTPPYEIQEQIDGLVEFIQENPDELSPVEMAAHVHYFFSHIHPFEDGNGRLARLLTNLILLRHRYPFIVFRKVERKQYLETLRKADQGEFEPFITFVARLVEQALDSYLLALSPASQSEPTELLPLSELVKYTPYSTEYLSLQARRGVIDAVKHGRIWKSNRKTIEKYIQLHGRKNKAKQSKVK